MTLRCWALGHTPGPWRGMTIKTTVCLTCGKELRVETPLDWDEPAQRVQEREDK